MKQILLMIAVVALVGGCGTTKVDSPQPTDNEVDPNAPTKLIADPIVEEAIRKELNKPTGDLTKAELANVTHLDLAYTKTTDAGLKEVAKLQNLTYLDLASTKITDVGLNEIAKMQNLTHLGLSSTKITDEGLKEIAKLQQLELLHLRYTKITDAGAAELQKALPNCRISR